MYHEFEHLLWISIAFGPISIAAKRSPLDEPNQLDQLDKNWTFVLQLV